MPYAAVTLATLQLRLRERHESSAYWTDEEGRLAINEALRVWNLLAAAWKKRETLAVPANHVWITLPGALSFAVRAEANSVPLEQASLFDLDCGRVSWEGERTNTGGVVPTSPSHWAPAGVFRVAVWPAQGLIPWTLTVDGLRATPVLRAPADTVDLNQVEERVLVGYGLHYLAFKQGGKFWASTRKYYQEFLQAAIKANERLLLSAFFRRAMGLDLDNDQRPIIRRPRPSSAQAEGQ